nr:activating signal cointegrator 1 complex subunit 2-like [Cherax quadricarinatus]
MSNTGAIPKGGARPKCDRQRNINVCEKRKDEGEVVGEPLDKKFVTCGGAGIVDKRVPALHIAWIQKGTYIKYVPPPLPDDNGVLPPGARESWLEQMEFLEQDLQTLLSLPHHKFWSQMVYDPAVHECLESYITSGFRWYDDVILDDYSRPVVESIHHLVFLNYVRMATYKESKTCHITPGVFGDIIYENYMFDICKLLDLCLLYGPTNGQLLAKMVYNIFTQQPKYYNDLSQAVSSICQALEKVEDKLGVADYNVPVALGAPTESLSIVDLHDIIIYLNDTFSSIQMLIALHPPAAQYFHVEAFELRMSAFMKSLPYIAYILMFQQHGGDVTSLTFIKEAVDMVLKEMGLSLGMTNLTLDESQSSKVKKSEGDTSGMNGYAQVGSTVPSHIELASLVSSVQDLLPDLGAGFIQECLKYYCYSTEDVIHALLEGSLPPSLVTLDHSMPALPESRPPSPQPSPSPMLEDNTQTKTVRQVDYMDRANVYNDDEFDVFSRSQIDRSRVKKGKKSQHTEGLKTDKESIDKIKEIARQYDERGGTSIYEDEFRYEDDHRAWDYEDEYDDTYDDNEAGNIDDLGVEKIVKRRPGIIGAGRLNTSIDYAYTEESPEVSDKEETTKEDTEEKEGISQKGPKGQVSVRPKNRSNTRGVQRVFHKSSKPKESTPTPERESSKEDGKDPNPPFRTTAPKPFCENPEVVRQRAEQRRQEAYRYRGRGRGQQIRRDDTLSNGIDGERYGPKQISRASSRSSGKSWRQGQGGDDDSRGYRGGKYKEDTNHGKAQSQQYRHKMMHKNEHKRFGAQAKFNKNS